jgi:hypothetical protein
MLSYIFSVRGYLNVFSILILFYYLVAIMINVKQEKIIISNIWWGFVWLLVCFVWVCVLCSWVLLYLIKLNNSSEHKLQAAWIKSYLE